MARVSLASVAAIGAMLALAPLGTDTAWASPGDAEPATLTPVESRTVQMPDGWLATALTEHEGHLWFGAQASRRPSVLQRYTADGQLLEQLRTETAGNVGGLAFCGQSMCNLDYGTNQRSGKSRLERLSTNGKLRHATPVVGGAHNTFGLAWNGSGFFQGHSPTVKPHSTIHRLDADGREIARAEMPFYTRGLTWHQGELWVTSGPYAEIHVLDAKLQVVRSYRTSVSLVGLAFIDGQLFGLEQNANRVHRFQLPRPGVPSSLLAATTPTRHQADTGWAPWMQ